MIGAGARALIQRGFESEGRTLAPDRLEELFGRFMVHYGENICVTTRLFLASSAPSTGWRRQDLSSRSAPTR